MMVTITTSGLFMYAVHIPAVARMPEAEYGVFVTLLQLLTLMLIPSIGLQTVFTQQTAAAVTVEHQQALTGAVRTLLFWTFVVWLMTAVAVFTVRESLVAGLRITNPAALWVTVLTVLPMLWLPIMQGLLQGTQNFLWLGWTALLTGAGRFATVLITVVMLGGYAAGGMVGAFCGTMAAFFVASWQTKSLWSGPALLFSWKPWLGRVIPLTLGLGASQIMLAADMVLVQLLFERDTGLYGAAGTLARGIVIFTGPLVMVMFPKIVQSAVRAHKTDVLMQTVLATALLGAMAATFLTLFPRLPFQVMNKADYFPIAPLIPWFCWCMLPLGLANVLLNSLLARARFRFIPAVLGVVAIYVGAEVVFGRYFKTGDRLSDFRTVVQILGVSNLLLLGVLIYFTRRERDGNGD